MSGKRKPRVNSILRMMFVGVALIFQIGWLFLRILALNEYSELISRITGIFCLVVVLKLYSKDVNVAMKLPWIMLIMAFPVMGLTMMLLFDVLGDLGKIGKKLKTVRDGLKPYLQQKNSVLERMGAQDLSAANQSRYLWKQEGWPVYENTVVKYYPEAAEAFYDMKLDLEKAEKFIFMEYFILENGAAFGEIREILERKAKQGVEVRLMYDDIGSVGHTNMAFAKQLNNAGIRCTPFNPAVPVLNLFMNHRDHRKITVIDGKVGYTGGYNLANEYFGYTKPYGHWKDTGIRLEGEAVRSLTAGFLELWSVVNKSKENNAPYLGVCHSVAARGYVQPFTDDPLDEERVAENVYLNLIAHARKTLYFMTPYLIITDEMGRALRLAAKRGVDVRIITPGVPDKKTVYAMTRSYYAGLVSQGVRIFEYEPGFCHAKQCICDGEIASIGTSNLDYRSLYHHFENDVVLYDCDAVAEMAEDFEKTFPQCREVTEKYASGRGAVLRMWQCMLRLFAPLV